MVLKGYIEEGERPIDAIARIAVLAGQNGCSGYALCCRKCNMPYAEYYGCECEEKIYQDYLKSTKPICKER